MSANDSTGMSSLAQRRAQLALGPSTSVKVFSRGVRRLRQTVGDDVNVWLKGPGRAYKEPKENGPNWLGKNHPFPMNPTFRPPPPISDATKTEIYARFMENPKKNSIRVLSSAYHISLKRVDAILRLKGLEESWRKGKEIQTGFVAGMEKILQPKVITRNMQQPLESRQDIDAADLQDETEIDSRARDRYQRLFWEPVADGEKPMLPQKLEEAKDMAKAARIQSANAKSDKLLLTGVAPEEEEPRTLPKMPQVVYKSDGKRPVTVFKDVGGRFLDVEDRRRRIHEAERRREARQKKGTA